MSRISLTLYSNIGAELGRLFKQMRDPGQKDHSDKEEPINPILFSQMFGRKAKRSSSGKPFNGESVEDCNEFLQELVAHLAREDVRKFGDKSDPRSLMHRLFGCHTVEMVSKQTTPA